MTERMRRKRIGEVGKGRKIIKDGLRDRWTDDFRLAIFSSVFQSYQEDEQVIMKSCVQGNSVYG